MRYVMTRVLPLPAPAKTRSGPFAWSTAFSCASLSSGMLVVELHIASALGRCESPRSVSKETSEDATEPVAAREAMPADGDGAPRPTRAVAVRATASELVIPDECAC